MGRVGLLRHWGAWQTRDGAESGTASTTVTYTTLVKTRCDVQLSSGQQRVKNRGSDSENTHRIETRFVKDISNANFLLMLNGPFKGQRFKVDTSALDRLGRRIIVRGFTTGDDDAFEQPDPGNLPDILDG